MNNDKQKFNLLIEKLIDFGEDAEELNYFKSIFEDLTEEEKGQLTRNLESELEALEKNGIIKP